MVARDRRVARRPRASSRAFQNLPLMARAAGQLYKAGSRALQPRQKSRKKSKGKGKSAVGALPRDRIGRDNGLITSNQKVPKPRAGSVQYRRSVFGAVAQADKCWIGGSTIGNQLTHFKTIAHAILAHYLPKMSDLRAANAQAPDAVPQFESLTVTYSKDAPSTVMRSTVPVFVDGTIISNDTYTQMALVLGHQIMEKARSGLFPTSIVFVAPVGGIGTNHSVLRDTNLGRHVITVSCSGRFRFQNVTPAGDGEPANSTNINAVDANPVNGKVYTFRNQAPLFSASYVSTLTDASTLAGIKALQTTQTVFDMYGNTVVPADGKGGDAFVHIAAPPLNPSSIFRNAKSTGNVTFPPGGFKTFVTSYLRSDSIFKYCQVISQADVSVESVTAADHATYPPAGDSFMMCVRPTIKTKIGEVIRMSYNTEHIMKAMIKPVKRSALQVVNLIE